MQSQLRMPLLLKIRKFDISEDRPTVKTMECGVSWIRNKVNMGTIGNYNRALDIAMAECIKLMSADDVLLPSVLIKQFAAFDDHATDTLLICPLSILSQNVILFARKCGGEWGGSVRILYCAGYALAKINPVLRHVIH